MHGTSEHLTLPGRGAAVDEVLLQNPLHGVESRSAADVQLVSLDKVAADEPVLERPRFPRLKFGILDEAVFLILDAPDEILELLALVPEQAMTIPLCSGTIECIASEASIAEGGLSAGSLVALRVRRLATSSAGWSSGPSAGCGAHGGIVP